MTTFPKLSYVCPIPWAELRGDERARFCEKCGHSVTNLSELGADARAALLSKIGKERLCVSFYRRLSGEYVTPDAPLTTEERSRIRQLGIAALSAGALALAAGCASTPVPSKALASSAEKKHETQASLSPDEEVIVLQAFGIVCDTPPPKKK